MYYTYNYKNQKWISSDADIYQPLFTPFSVKQKKAWYSVHKKWEACGKALNGKLFYECGCPIPSQFASVNNWSNSKVETTEIPARDMVKLRVDLVLTSVSADGKKSYSYAYKTWAFYMKTGAIVPYESSEFLKKYRINLPESITAEVQALLSDYAKKLYGNIYEFILPLDTNELYDLGEAMHNCVGTLYRNAALKRLSIIVGMKLNGKYQACIEIKTKDKEITQALDPCNRNLPAEIRNTIRKWALERDIGIATTHLRR